MGEFVDLLPTFSLFSTALLIYIVKPLFCLFTSFLEFDTIQNIIEINSQLYSEAIFTYIKGVLCQHYFNFSKTIAITLSLAY